MIVVGIDPSLSATGLAWGDGSLSTITYPKTTTGDARLDTIYDELEYVLQTPMTGRLVDLAVVEDLPTHAHGAGRTGMAQGVVRLQLQRMGVPYVTVTAATVKKFATGKGTATKPDMRMSLYQRVGLDVRDDNQCDAWWLRELGLNHLGEPTIRLPKTHLVALAKVTGWPRIEPGLVDVPDPRGLLS